MILDVVLLATFAVILAWPAPIILAAAQWPMRRPAAALLLWQAIGLAGGLALLTAELTLAAGAREESWIASVRATMRNPLTGLNVWRGIGLVLFAATAVWLVTILIASTIRVAAARRRHRYMLGLLADPEAVDVDADVLVVAHATATAYALPGRRPAIVVSQAARDALRGNQLRAVIEHERAHLRQHHDVVVQPFVAWRRSFPFLASAGVALRAVERLTECLADDAARRRVGDEPLGGALAVMGTDGLLSDTKVGGRGTDVTDRLARLLRPSVRNARLGNALAGVCAAVIVLAPPVLLLAAG